MLQLIHLEDIATARSLAYLTPQELQKRDLQV